MKSNNYLGYFIYQNFGKLKMMVHFPLKKANIKDISYTKMNGFINRSFSW